MDIHRTWAVWSIAILCTLGYVLGHIVHWHTLETAQIAWRAIGQTDVFRSSTFWSFALFSTLLHTGPIHLALNLWCLVVLGAYIEHRDGSIAVLIVWVVSAYAGMGTEALLGGVGRIGLSAATYALLGAVLVDWRDAARSPRRQWTAVGMLAFLLVGGLEWIGLPPLVPEVAHVAHAVGLLTGLLFALALRRGRQFNAS